MGILLKFVFVSGTWYGIKDNKDLSELTLQELQTFSDQIGDDVFDVLIEYYSHSDREEYEKCAKVRDILNLFNEKNRVKEEKETL